MDNGVQTGVNTGTGYVPPVIDSGSTRIPLTPVEGIIILASTEGPTNTINPLDNIIYTDKVRSQAAQDDYHGFPEVVDSFGMQGEVTSFVGNDSIVRTKVSIPGSYKGKEVPSILLSLTELLVTIGNLNLNSMIGECSNMNYESRLPKTFPDMLLDSAKSLDGIGVLELAWDWKNAIRVVEFLWEHNYAILGGDVYQLSDGKFHSTYDNWYVNKNIKKSKKEFLEETKSKAISYISKYSEMNGDGFYYSIVFEKM